MNKSEYEQILDILKYAHSCTYLTDEVYYDLTEMFAYHLKKTNANFNDATWEKYAKLKLKENLNEP